MSACCRARARPLTQAQSFVTTLLSAYRVSTEQTSVYYGLASVDRRCVDTATSLLTTAAVLLLALLKAVNRSLFREAVCVFSRVLPSLSFPSCSTFILFPLSSPRLEVTPQIHVSWWWVSCSPPFASNKETHTSPIGFELQRHIRCFMFEQLVFRTYLSLLR